MSILAATDTLIKGVLTARAERIAQDPGSEETLDPRQPQPSRPVDTVEISKQYERMKEHEERAANAPRVDWENRTYQGQKIPDTWHKEPTPEMISGEQPFIVATNALSGEQKYIEWDVSPKEYGIAKDYEFIQNSLQQIDDVTARAQAYDSGHIESGKAPDPMAQMLFGIGVKSAETSFQRYLENMVLGYDMLGMNLNDVRDQMLKLSNGTFDLAELLSKYFSTTENISTIH